MLEPRRPEQLLAHDVADVVAVGAWIANMPMKPGPERSERPTEPGWPEPWAAEACSGGCEPSPCASVLSTWAAALFPSERFGFGLGAISSELGFFLWDFFGTPPAALACFAGCFALALAMLTRSALRRALAVAFARAPSKFGRRGVFTHTCRKLDIHSDLCIYLTRTNFIREGLPKGGHSSTRTRDVP